jgi:hypothetical protein
VEPSFEVLGDVLENGLEGDLVQAAFWRPLLFGLDCCRYQTDETGTAVAMARSLDCVFDGNIVEARNAFSGKRPRYGQPADKTDSAKDVKPIT